ncbi:MAG: LEA type 2 family protein [Gammaproteobacteria bacterium]
MKKLLAIILVSLSLMGCNSEMIQQFVEAPQVKNIQLKSFSAQDKSVVFEVDLFNPNPFTLPLSGLSGEMSLNEFAIGSLDASSDQSLAANTTQTVTVPVQLDQNALLEAAKSVFTKRQANYNFNGGVKTSVGKIPFSKSGELSVQEILSSLIR